MSGLVLKLAPNERILINGAIIESGDRRTKIAIKTPNVNVLRLRDAMTSENVRTPVSRACYIAQMVLSGDGDPVERRRQLLLAIEQLSQLFKDHDSRLMLAEATAGAVEGNAYQAMRKLRELLPREAKLFATVCQ